jgi:hypothetical protein
MTRSIETMIAQEIITNASAMIHDLTSRDPDGSIMGGDITDALYECSYPVPDYESAAREQGFHLNDDGEVQSSGEDEAVYTDWYDACDQWGIEPHEREVFEHWIVSQWLAHKLEAKGEAVTHDLFGWCIWGRTTTGQAIVMDSVIQEIYEEAAR